MLLRFRATNFASLRDEQELSLIALDEHPDLATSKVPRSDERTVPVVGIFGPNASGKSNMIKALLFARTVIIESHQQWLPEAPVPRWPFRLDEGSRNAPSRFIFDFVHDAVRYEYGFSLNDTSIEEEWLYSWPKGKRTLFERTGMDVGFGSSLTGHKAVIADVVRENSLFLSAAAANNHPQLRGVGAWFSRWRRMTSRGHPIDPMSPLDEKTIGLLRYADIGIIGSVMVERSQEELDLSRGRVRRTRVRPRVDKSDEEFASRSVPSVELIHQATTESGGESLPWHWESSGTQTWLRISERAIHCLATGALLIVDDLGSDLHPLLTAQLIGLFQDRVTNPSGAQLIFTGHDVSILGKHVEHRLRRDQVWLAAKDSGGATAIYPLTEYGRIRDGLDDVEGRYLQGRYGAVPFFDRSLLPGLYENSERT